jgi:hypothetical protein
MFMLAQRTKQRIDIVAVVVEMRGYAEVACPA